MIPGTVNTLALGHYRIRDRQYPSNEYLDNINLIKDKFFDMDSLKADIIVDRSAPTVYEPKESQTYNVKVNIVEKKKKRVTMKEFDQMIENAERIHKESFDEELIGFREIMLESYEINEDKPVEKPQDDILKDHFDFLNELMNL